MIPTDFIFVLAALFLLGDAVLAYLLVREQQRHTLTKAALKFWRREANLR